MQLTEHENHRLNQVTGGLVLLFLLGRGTFRGRSTLHTALWCGLGALILLLSAAGLYLQWRARRAKESGTGGVPGEGTGETAAEPGTGCPETAAEREPAALPVAWLEFFGRHAPVFLAANLADRFFYILYRDAAKPFGGLNRLLTDTAIALFLLLSVSRFLRWPGAAPDRRLLERSRRYIDRIFYVCFAYIYCYRFLKTTTITEYVQWEHPLTRVFYVCISVMLVIAVTEACLQKSHLRWLLMSGIVASAYLHYACGGGRIYIYALLLLMVAAAGKNFRVILWITLIGGISVTLIGFGAAKAGFTKYIVRRNDTNPIPRYCLGSISPTDFSAHLLYLSIGWCMLRKSLRGWRYYLDYLALAACFLIAWFVNGGRTNSALLLLLIAGTLVRQLYQSRVRTGPSAPDRLLTAVSYIASSSFVVFFVYILSQVSVGKEKRFLIGYSFLEKFFNMKSMNSRFRDGRKSFLQYPVTLFGNQIKEVGNGGLEGKPEVYTFIDLSYLRVLLVGGIAVTVILIGGMTWIMLRHARRHMYYIVFLMFLIAANCLMEHHLFELSYNIYPLLLFSLYAYAPPGTGGGDRQDL